VICLPREGPARAAGPSFQDTGFRPVEERRDRRAMGGSIPQEMERDSFSRMASTSPAVTTPGTSAANVLPPSATGHMAPAPAGAPAPRHRRAAARRRPAPRHRPTTAFVRRCSIPCARQSKSNIWVCHLAVGEARAARVLHPFKNFFACSRRCCCRRSPSPSDPSNYRNRDSPANGARWAGWRAVATVSPPTDRRQFLRMDFAQLPTA
jgi:hypothetical protein